jgi:hypothetical protein
MDLRFDLDDGRHSDLDDGTVFYFYDPFTGPVLSAVLDRLHAAAMRRAIVVCALGVDLNAAPWLARREIDAFWLSVYDSCVPGVSRRRVHSRLPMSPEAAAVAFESPRQRGGCKT